MKDRLWMGGMMGAVLGGWFLLGLSGCGSGGGGGSASTGSFSALSASAEARPALRDDRIELLFPSAVDGETLSQAHITLTLSGEEVSLAGSEIRVGDDPTRVVITLTTVGRNAVDLVEGAPFSIEVGGIGARDGASIPTTVVLSGTVVGTQALFPTAASAEALPGIGDDLLTLSFSKPIAPESVAVSRLFLESPAGTVVVLDGHTVELAADGKRLDVTLSGVGPAQLNLLVGARFRLTPTGLIAVDGTPIPEAVAVDGVVGGLQALFAGVAISARPDLADDRIGILFSKPVPPEIALDPASYSLEIPPGRAVSLDGVRAAGDGTGQRMELVFDAPGAGSTNLPAGLPFRFRFGDLRSVEGAPLAPDRAVVDGIIGGINVRPQILSVEPGSLVTSGGEVTIRGTGFTFPEDTTVFVGGFPLEDVRFLDAETITGSVGRLAPGELDLVVTNTNGTGRVAGGLGIRLPEPLFDAVVSLPVGEDPRKAASADLDGDGREDLAVVNTGSDSISLFRRTASGALVPETPVATRSAPRDLALVDVDGDGSRDLLVVSRLDDRLEVGLGNGFDFGSLRRFRTLERPDVLEAADFDGDGRIDVAIASRSARAISIRSGDGTGAFPEDLRLDLPEGPTEMVSLDLDGDADLDLAVTTDRGNVLLLRNDGPGAFVLDDTLEAGGVASGLVVHDFDRDLREDLTVSSLGQADVSIFFREGDGFRDPLKLVVPPPVLESGAAGAEPSVVTVARGRDERRSLVVGFRSGYGATVVDHDPVRGFLAPVPLLSGEGVEDLAVLSPVEDRLPDLVTLNRDSGTISQITRRNNGSLRQPFRLGVGDDPRDAALGDFDGDGHLDLAVACRGARAIDVLLGNGEAEFEFGTRVALDGRPVAVRSGDFDGDGHLDLVVADEESGTLLRMTGTGTGDFGASSLPGRVDGPFALVDLDRDGDLDLVSTRGATLRLGHNDGTGAFDEVQRIETGASIPVSLGTGDLDGDGRVDLAIGSLGETDGDVRVGVAFGTADGQLEEWTERLFRTPRILSVAIVDLDGDGAADLVSSERRRSSVGRVRVLLGDGTRELPDQGRDPHRIRNVDGPDRQGNAVIRDLDGDGRLDLALPSAVENRVDLRFNRGGLQFETAPGFAVGRAPGVLLSGDLDGNGTIDLISLDRGHATVTVLERRG